MNNTIKKIKEEINRLKEEINHLAVFVNNIDIDLDYPQTEGVKKQSNKKVSKIKKIDSTKIIKHISQHNIKIENNYITSSNKNIVVKLFDKDNKKEDGNYIIKNNVLIKSDFSYCKSDLEDDTKEFKYDYNLTLNESVLDHLYRYLDICSKDRDITNKFMIHLSKEYINVTNTDTYRLISKKFKAEENLEGYIPFSIPTEVVKIFKYLNLKSINLNYNSEFVVIDIKDYNINIKYKNNIEFFDSSSLIDRANNSNIINIDKYIKENIKELIKTSSVQKNDKYLIEIKDNMVFDGLEWKTLDTNINKHIKVNIKFLAKMLDLNKSIAIDDNMLVIKDEEITFLTMLCRV